MRSDRTPLGLKIAAGAGLLFLHVPILLIFVYAFTTEEKSFQWPPPGLTLKWFAVTWNRPDVWAALSLSLKVASISTAASLPTRMMPMAAQVGRFSGYCNCVAHACGNLLFASRAYV